MFSFNICFISASSVKAVKINKQKPPFAKWRIYICPRTVASLRSYYGDAEDNTDQRKLLNLYFTYESELNLEHSDNFEKEL